MTLPTKFRRLKLWIVAIPLAIMLLGIASNQLVLIANHGKFPVMWNGVYGSGIAVGQFKPRDAVHCMMGSSTHLNFLADVFDLGDGIYSIGDLVQMLGEYLSSFAPAVWIFTLCSLVLKGKDEPLKQTPARFGTIQGLGGQDLGIGTVTGPSFNRTAMCKMSDPNTQMRVC